MGSLRMLVLAGVVVLGTTVAARASECEATCGGAKRTCQNAAATANRTCKAALKSAVPQDRHDAAKTCRDAFKAAKEQCVAAIHDCLDVCHNPPAPGSCAAGCQLDARICVKHVIADGKSCLQSCKGTKGPDRLACVTQCGAQGKAGLDACAATRTQCLAGCPASPSGAFVD